MISLIPKSWIVFAVIIAGIFIYYEGIPIAKDVPFIGPRLEGRVDRVARAANEGLLTKIEAEALRAQINAEKALRDLAERRAKALDQALRDFQADELESENDAARRLEELKNEKDAPSHIDRDILNRLRNN